MPRFRLFGRPSAAAPPALPFGPSTGAPAPWGPAPAVFGNPATDAARPAALRNPTDDPPTDPLGFPPIPAQRAEVPFDTSPDPAPHPADAASLACAFAADYLSWDEDDPARRGRVLIDYLSAPGADPARLGWSGRGRQRAEFAVPGRARPDGDGRMLVDVRVRVTPYRKVGDHTPEPPVDPGDDPDIAGIPAVAPAPIGRGWRSLASYWIRLSVPVVHQGGRLVVDAWEETLGEEPDEPEPDDDPDNGIDDPSLADDSPTDDEPVAGRRIGGAW